MRKNTKNKRHSDEISREDKKKEVIGHKGGRNKI